MSEKYATKRELDSVKGRMTKLEKCVRELPDLPELPEIPDMSEAFNEVADNFNMQVAELRLALSNLAVAAAETRKTADKCAELLGVVT